MIQLGVLFGSRSVEHEISIITAMQAISQLKASNKYNITPIYISKAGDWYTGGTLDQIETYKNLDTAMQGADKVTPIRLNGRVALLKSPLSKFKNNVVAEIDLAFPIMHGSYGEDGTLQGMLEQLQLPYTGCGVLGAALTMDKITTKQVLSAVGIPVVEYFWFHAETWFAQDEKYIAESERRFGYPVVIKPADIGSSVGVAIAHDREEFDQAVSTVRRYSERVLVERYVKGLKEINISVLGDAEGVSLSVCEEPLTASEFLTYQDKYSSGNTSAGSKGTETGASGAGMQSAKRRIPAELPEDVLKTIQKYARLAFSTLDCSGVSRIDFILEPGDGPDSISGYKNIFINEFNTIPGSLSFYLWEATGKPYAELLDDLVELALRRKRRRSKLIFTHDINILASGSFGGKK
jgi:D-alanine-D-alanine ligase